MKLAIVSDEISQDFESAVVLAKQWGIEYVEIRSVYLHRTPDLSDRERDLLHRTVDRYGVKVISLSPGLFKIREDAPEVEDHLGDRLRRSAELAHDLGTEELVIFGFVKPRDAPSEAYPQRVVDLMGRAAERAKEEGVTLLLENEPICWADGGEITAEIVSKVGSDRLWVNWDPCNAFSSGEDRPYPEGYEHVKPYVRHLHIKDARRTEGGGRAYVPVGEGEIDWPGQLDALRKDGYDGYHVVETHFGPGIETSERCVKGVRRIVEGLW